jgi:cytochrome P450
MPRNVQAEIDKARREGKLTQGIPKLRDIQDHLPYLDACVKESMRLHNVVGVPLPRVVPEGGVELEGRRIPAGVSISSA